MTLPRTAAEVLADHVVFEIRSVDRMLVSFRQPRLQYGSGIHGFFCHHRGYRYVSSALMHPMTERFAADIHHYVASRDLDLVHFAKGQRKDDIARSIGGSAPWPRPVPGHQMGDRAIGTVPPQTNTRPARGRIGIVSARNRPRHRHL